MAAAMSLWLSAYALCDYGGTRWRVDTMLDFGF
jgi:hypothetical protein